MKTLFSFLFIGILHSNIFCQTNTKILGIWQAKLNGKNLTGNDLGMTQAPYNSRFIFYIFTKDKMYFAIAPNKSAISKATLPNLIKKQEAADGTYSSYETLDLIPEDIRSKYEAWLPFNDKTIFIEGSVQSEPMSFYFETVENKFLGLSKENQLQLVFVGAFK